MLPEPPLLASVLRPTSRRFVAWWLALLLLHVLCVVFYVGFALAYHHLPKSNLEFQFRTYSIGITQSQYSNIAVAHAVVAAIHGAYLVCMVVASLQSRQFAFFPSWRRLVRGTNAKFAPPAHSISRSARRGSTQDSVLDQPRVPLRRDTLVQFGVDVLSRAAHAVLGKRGPLGIEFVYFDHMLLARELVETGLQSYQAYRMTRLLPRLWLIRLYVALLVANCWVVPILHRVYMDRLRLRRMMSLICDTALDIVSSIGISLFLVYSYAPQYTDPRFGFPFNNWYNDEWFVTVLQEFQMMVVVSWGDMASRLVFAFGVLQSMDNLKEMLTQELRRRKSAAIRAAAIQRASIAAAAIAPAPAPVIKPLPRLSTGPSTADVVAKSEPAPREHAAVHFILHVVAPAFFVVWGVVIFVVHVYAESQHIDEPCRLPLRPWLSGKPACSLVEIDCYALSTTTTMLDAPADAWTTFDPALTAGLVIRHCPKLTIPSSMALFTGITSMKVYNATIVSWPEGSGLTHTSHQRLRALYLIRTNFTDATLPPGLLRDDFPKTFRSFFVSATNLASFPSTLDGVWPPRMAISVEWAGFTSIPPVILQLKPGMLSFSRNPLASVPASLFEISTLGNLLLSYTDLQELPRNVTHLGARLYLLFVEGTNVSTFWSWMDPFIVRSLSYHKGFFNAAGTPFCRDRAKILDGTLTKFPVGNQTDLASIMDVSTPARLAFANASVACESDFKTLFPLAAQDDISAIR